MTEIKLPNLPLVPLKNAAPKTLNANSLAQLADGVAGNVGIPFAGRSQQLSQAETLYINQRWYLISNQRALLSQLYTEHGIVRALCTQPVEDGLRKGIKITSKQLDGDDVTAIINELNRLNAFDALREALIWSRLYGGGAVVIATNQNPAKPFKPDSIAQGDVIGFRPVDLWELYGQYETEGYPYNKIMIEDEDEAESLEFLEGEFYSLYDVRLHKSRVLRVQGEQAPSFLRPRLRGWGLSQIEHLVRPLNQFLKNEDVVFELLDEAKIDVFSIQGLNDALSHIAGTSNVVSRIHHANTIKNTQNAVVLDKEDAYEQKNITFSGLDGIIAQIRISIAAAARMPVAKLFGMSAAGFNSGEDDIENYNGMVESNIRSRAKPILHEMIGLVCRKLYGFAPDDLEIEFHPLRELSAKDEEEIKDRKFNRATSAYTSGLATPQEAKQAINAENLLPISLDETTDAYPPQEPPNDPYTIPASGNVE